MPKRLPLPALVLSVSTLSIWGCDSAGTRPVSDDDAITRVERGLLPPVPVSGSPGWTIEERMERWKVEGVSVAVIQDFEIAWAKAYGLADRETGQLATTETLFQAGSISKPVAATSALRLVEQGRLDLDAPINDALESWQLPDNELTARAPVTLRRLLSHSAGTTVHGFPGYAVGEAVPTVVQVLDGEPPTNTAPVRVDLEPGTQYRYSGGGITIAQLAMTDVADRDFPALLRGLVLEPAGMTHSTYQQPLPPARLRDAAAGYGGTGDGVPGKRHTYPEMAAAGLWTTASDLARFAIAIQNSVRGEEAGVLEQETAREMLTAGLGDAGLGFFIVERDGAVYFEHGGADRGFQAYLIAHRDDGYGAAVMANSDNGNAIAMEILRAIAAEYGWIGFVPDAVERVAVPEERLDAYAGRYSLDNSVRVYWREGEELMARVPLATFRSRLIPIGAEEFLVEENGARVIFRLGEDGSAVAQEDADDGDIYERLDEGEMVPEELFEEGRTDEGLAALTAADAPEDRVNSLGYRLLNLGRIDQAVAVFELNTQRHAASTNPWDSLADGYLAAGDTAGAVGAYWRVLEAAERDAASDPAQLQQLVTRARSQLEQLGAGN